MNGAIEGFITGGMNSNHCFVAGTLVQTIDGAIPIEQIEEGEYVLSEDPETGDGTYKRVLETYINETTDAGSRNFRIVPSRFWGTRQ